MSAIPDIVVKARLDTEIHPEYTQHVRYRSGSTLRERRVPVQERWRDDLHLGRGGFGDVWRQTKLSSDRKGEHTGEYRAVKRLQKNAHQDFYAELEAIALLSDEKHHACFVEFYGWYENAANIFIAMEYFHHGDLQSYLKAPLPEAEACAIAGQLLEGLEFMDQYKITHRDLKPANILIKVPGPNWWVKIADFGVSKRVLQGQSGLQTLTGTVAFSAPEVLFPKHLTHGPGHQGYTKAVDIWSFGVVMFWILTQEVPFGNEQLLKYSTTGTGFPKDLLMERQISNQACQFIMGTMARKAQDRPSIPQLQGHGWMKLYNSTYSTLNSESFLSPNTNIHEPTSSRRLSADDANISRTSSRSSGLTTYLRQEHVGREQQFLNDFDALQIDPTSNFAKHDSISTATTAANPNMEHPPASTSGLGFNDGRISPNPGNFRPFPSVRKKTAEKNIFQKIINKVTEKKTLKDGSFTSLQNASAILAGPLASATMPTPSESNYKKSSEWEDLFDRGIQQYDDSQYHLAEESFKLAVVAGRNEFGPASYETAHVILALGATQCEQEKWLEAEQSLDEAYPILRRWLGDEHEQTAYCVDLLGTAQLGLEKFNKAEQSFEIAFSSRRSTFGHYSPETADSVHQLGVAQGEQGKYFSAERSFTIASNIRESLYGWRHLNTADSVGNRGIVQARQHKWALAEQSLDRALHIYKVLSGLHDEMTAFCMFELGRVAYAQMNYPKAEWMFREATNTNKVLYGFMSEETATGLYWLGMAQGQQGNYAAAEISLGDALVIQKQIFGLKYRDTVCSLHMMGLVLYRQRKYPQAEHSLTQALSYRQELYGNQSTQVAITATLLGHMLYEQKRYFEAKDPLWLSVSIGTRLYGHNHPQVVFDRKLYEKVQSKINGPSWWPFSSRGDRNLASESNHKLDYNGYVEPSQGGRA